MNDKDRKPEESMAKGRRKRVAPTIDLTATEVPQANDAPPDTQPETTQPETTLPVTSEADPPPSPQAAVEVAPIHELPTSEIAPPNEPPFDNPPPGDVSPDQSEPPDSESMAATAPDNHTPKPSGFGLSASVLAAGFVGAAAMSAVLLSLWLTGLLPIRFAALTATRARVAALELQLQDLQKKPAAAVDAQAIDVLTQRVAKMDEAIKALPKTTAADPALVQRVDAADNALKSLGVALTALNRRGDEVADKAAQAQQHAEAADKAVAELRASIQDVSKAANAGASSADLESSQRRIAALEQQAQTAKTEISKATASDQSARLALSAATLRDTVLRGAPYADELAQVKALGGDDKQLAPLQSFAAAGVPGDKTLAQELAAILPGIEKAVAPAPSGGFLERLQANAAQLVRVRPVDAPAGDDVSTLIARIESETAKADIGGALSDVGKLPEKARQMAADWVTRASARQQAVAAAKQFAADAARSLGTR